MGEEGKQLESIILLEQKLRGQSIDHDLKHHQRSQGALIGADYLDDHYLQLQHS